MTIPSLYVDYPEHEGWRSLPLETQVAPTDGEPLSAGRYAGEGRLPVAARHYFGERRPRPGLGDHHRTAAFRHGVGQSLQTHYRQRNDPFAVILES